MTTCNICYADDEDKNQETNVRPGSNSVLYRLILKRSGIFFIFDDW